MPSWLIENGNLEAVQRSNGVIARTKVIHIISTSLYIYIFVLKFATANMSIERLLVNVAKKKFKKAVANPLHCSLLNYIYNMHL